MGDASGTGLIRGVDAAASLQVSWEEGKSPVGFVGISVLLVMEVCWQKGVLVEGSPAFKGPDGHRSTLALPPLHRGLSLLLCLLRGCLEGTARHGSFPGERDLLPRPGR